MKKIIALALITSFVATGTAMAQVGAAAGQGSRGGGGPGGPGDGGPDANGREAIQITVPQRYKRPLTPPKFPELCRSGDEMVASENDCNHYSR